MELKIDSELLWKLIQAVLDNTDAKLAKIHEELDEIQKELGIYDKKKESCLSTESGL